MTSCGRPGACVRRDVRRRGRASGGMNVGGPVYGLPTVELLSCPVANHLSPIRDAHCVCKQHVRSAGREEKAKVN